jgi:uncharacterized membrane protein
MIKPEEFVKQLTEVLGTFVEGTAALVIGFAVIQASCGYIKSSIRRSNDKLQLRLTLGKTLALTLEFLLAADILRTAVAPTWEDIGKLSAIAALRTLMNYFLERELSHN